MYLSEIGCFVHRGRVSVVVVCVGLCKGSLHGRGIWVCVHVSVGKSVCVRECVHGCVCMCT